VDCEICDKLFFSVAPQFAPNIKKSYYRVWGWNLVAGCLVLILEIPRKTWLRKDRCISSKTGLIK